MTEIDETVTTVPTIPETTTDVVGLTADEDAAEDSEDDEEAEDASENDTE